MEKICSNCESKARTAGLCNKHYLESKRRAAGIEPRARKTCSLCNSYVFTHGLCNKHHKAKKRREQGIPERPPFTSAREKLNFYSTQLPNGCRVWNANSSRYGKVFWNGVMHMAHRLSYEIEHGKIPEGLHACHKCDNSLCVNPDHIFLGTHQDNMDDKKMKGRINPLKGSHNPLSKLTEDKVRAILADKRPRKEIAQTYGVNVSVIQGICRGATWKHVPR